ncbi:RNA polymerase II transcriptional coactivator SUB1 [Leucoagaricus sp. SymC.cos]|nr:RNA polymerase II transcriptional coactivator SUB1 [Leucoagaricus sp. SymC.cos]
MAKRKVDSESEDEAQFSDASSEPKQKSKPPAKKAATKRTKAESSPMASTAAKKAEDNASSPGIIQRNSDGEKYIDLGKKKRATVRSFKDIPLLDIREFYGTGSGEKPGKKGISLTLEQWHVLKANVDAIDDFFSELSKGAE